MPRRSTSGIFATLAIFAALTVSAGPSFAEDAHLGVELNKLETTEAPACRTFFLFRNETGQAFEGFEMSLAILDNDGIIDQLLNIDAAPLPVARTTLRLFEIPGIACESISEVLLHAIDVCKPQNAPEADCFEFISLESRTSAALVK